MFKSIRSRTAVAAVLAAAAVVPAAGGADANAAVVKAKPPCKPSIFHPTVTTYKNLHIVKRKDTLYGQPSLAQENTMNTTQAFDIGLTSTQTKEMTISSSVTVEAGALAWKIQGTLGISASVSVSASTSLTWHVNLKPHKFAWVQAKTSLATVKGTAIQTDMICNKVLRRGPLTTVVPYKKPWLANFVANHPPN